MHSAAQLTGALLMTTLSPLSLAGAMVDPDPQAVADPCAGHGPTAPHLMRSAPAVVVATRTTARQSVLTQPWRRRLKPLRWHAS
jgi:hypothetical protein